MEIRRNRNTQIDQRGKEEVALAPAWLQQEVDRYDVHTVKVMIIFIIMAIVVVELEQEWLKQEKKTCDAL